MGDAQRLRLQQQRRPRRIINKVAHKFRIGKLFQINRGAPVFRIGAHRRGVHDDLRVLIGGKTVVSSPIHPNKLLDISTFRVGYFRIAGDKCNTGAHIPQHGAHGGTCPAAAQHQRPFSGRKNAVFLQQIFEAKVVRVVPENAAVPPPQQGVHVSCCLGRGREGVAEGVGRFFVGNGHVQPVPSSALQEVRHSLWLRFKQGVVIVPQQPVKGRRMAVYKGFPQQSAPHQSTSPERIFS